MPKLKSLKIVYGDAKIITINRDLRKTLPSSIALVNVLYGLFTSTKPNKKLNDKTLEFLIEWYIMAYNALNNEYKGQYIDIDFNGLISIQKKTIKKIADFLDLPTKNLLKTQSSKKHKSFNIYTPFNEKKLAEILKKSPLMKAYSELKEL